MMAEQQKMEIARPSDIIDQCEFDDLSEFWTILFTAAVERHRQLTNQEIARRMGIASSLIGPMMQGKAAIGLQSRLWALDMLDLPWTYHLMLLAMGEKYAYSIHRYFTDSQSEDYYKLDGNYSTPPKFWRQLIDFTMKENEIKTHRAIAKEIQSQPPALSAFLAGRADIRLEQKIYLLRKIRLKPDISVIDAMLPLRIVDSFKSMPVYHRFLKAIAYNVDVGPRRSLMTKSGTSKAASPKKRP